jgi:hypothetical protein
LLQTDPAALAESLPVEAWAAHAAGEGSKGLRLYDWARIALPWVVDEGFERWLLIRRSRRDGQDRAYYLVFAPAGTQLAELAGAAGLRWTIEECFQRAKEELGLDHCEVRSWHGWHRHMTLRWRFSPGLPLSCAASRLANRTKGVRAPSPREDPRCPAAERARDPFSHRPPAACADRYSPFHIGVVVMAETAPSSSGPRSLPLAT